MQSATMLNARECLANAVEMERQARLCDALDLRVDMLSMAESWRYLAQQALWQDSLTALAPLN